MMFKEIATTLDKVKFVVKAFHAISRDLSLVIGFDFLRTLPLKGTQTTFTAFSRVKMGSFCRWNFNYAYYYFGGGANFLMIAAARYLEKTF